MPCDKLAVLTAVANTDLNVLFDGDKAKIKAAVQAITAKALDLRVQQVSVMWDTDGRLEIYARGTTYRVSPKGVRSTGSGSGLQTDTKRLAAALKALCGLVTQAKVTAALKARYQVTEERRLPSGQVVLTLEV